MAKTPHEAALPTAEADESPWGRSTSSGEQPSLGPVRCPHCTEAHPPTYSHCPRTGRPLQTGPALVGRVIAGRYRVTGILGEGGMGAVYIAEHLALGRKVAIKRLHPELTSDEKAVARFQREARAAAATGHEHIVEVLDLGYAEDGAPYLVMEYLRGTALAQVLKQEGRLPVARTANIIGQVLAALAAVHRLEIVHRDLKPDNVFLTRRGGVADYVKVLDFGISKMKHEEGEPANLTRTGVTMGTPYYMSPEQARGIRKLDHRVDLYAVSVMLYECLTGRLPLVGDNYHALLQQILRVEPIAPSVLLPGLPSGLDAVLLKGLAKEPAQRFASATEMLEALVPFGARAADAAAMIATLPAASATTSAPIQTGPALERIDAPRTDGKVDARAPTESAISSESTVPATRFEAPSADPGRFEPREPTVSPARAKASSTHLSRPPPAAHGATPATPEQRAKQSTVGRVAPIAKATPSPPSLATGPRYFFLASDDWSVAPDRLARPALPATPAAAMSSTPVASAVSATGPSLPRIAPVAERGVADASPRPSHDEAQIKGSLVAGLRDHLEAELGAAGAAHALLGLEPAMRQKLDGVILPMAWLPLALFDAVLRALDREGADTARVIAAGRAAAERELSTTHRLFLQTATPGTVLERLPHLHRLYFSRGEARVSTLPAGARIELDGVGPESPALVAWLSGFWQRALELAGAREVKIAATTSLARGDAQSGATLRFR